MRKNRNLAMIAITVASAMVMMTGIASAAQAFTNHSVCGSLDSGRIKVGDAKVLIFHSPQDELISRYCVEVEGHTAPKTVTLGTPVEAVRVAVKSSIVAYSASYVTDIVYSTVSSAHQVSPRMLPASSDPESECSGAEGWNGTYDKVEAGGLASDLTETSGALTVTAQNSELLAGSWSTGKYVVGVVAKSGSGSPETAAGAPGTSGSWSTDPQALSHLTVCYGTEPPPPTHPSAAIVKTTVGESGTPGDGIEVPVGDTVTWAYTVTNTGDVTLTGVSVTDNQEVTVTCPKTELAAAESMTCSATGVATEGAV